MLPLCCFGISLHDHLLLLLLPLLLLLLLLPCFRSARRKK
jgi:hypothetical protein